MVQNLVLGLVYGGIYGLLAVGIVLVYRGSRVLNFAQGEMGTFGLYAAWWLSTEQGLPWIVGAAGAVATATIIGLAFERFIVRPMGDQSRLAVAVATVGLLLFLLALGFRAFGESPRSVAGPIRGSIEVAGVFVSGTQILSLVITAAIGVALAVLLRRTDFGLAVLAAADDPTAVRLVGVPLRRVSAFTWGTGAAISALAVLLIEPTVGVFAPGFASELFVKGLAAALVGGLTSLPGAFVGGLVVGLLEVFVTDATLTSSLPGIPTLSVFALILVVLLARPQGLFGATQTREAA
ncbi:MAG TPA: branched-chain amino acid ABC transporter permease [Acidimicrobiales bacterium]|jgi:branched-chain amino acid transport system permease protein|nr:branched-chain amino acid ABC transporter permease [Acidimicrobiales bacterium]